MTRVFLFIIAFLLIAPMHVVHANDDFAAVPILHDGRIKPLDSFACIHLKLFSGSESVDGLSARGWLMESLFDPPSGFGRRIFKINNPDIRDLLSLPKQKGHLYSLEQLSPALDAQRDVIDSLFEIGDNDLSRSQRELLTLNSYRILYSQILRAMTLVAPLSIQPPASFDLDQKETYTALDLSRLRQKGEEKLQAIIKAKGLDPVNYTDDELDIAQFMMQLQILDNTTGNNVLFRIIPPQWVGSPDGNQIWMSPWVMIQSGQGSPEAAAYLQYWEDAALAYKQQDKDALERAFANIFSAAKNMLPADKSAVQLQAELLYNTLHPFHMALLCLSISILFVCAYAMRSKQYLYQGIWSASILAIIFMVFGLSIRILVLDRPPVSTLFESTLFVSLIIMIGAILAEVKYKGALSLFGGAISAAILLGISSSMAVNPDDKEVLVAVLDTNFWLTTHVLIVTAGYGLCLLCSALAHIYLGLSVLKKETYLKKLFHAVYISGLFALLFMSVGTILGGVWADQSWGRFWGWDPKENGALLIILWLIWALHGRISGHFKKIDLVALMGLLGIVVILSWFGVNLLSIGLHSYGFIGGIATGIITFCSLEFLLIGGSYGFLKWQEKRCA